MIHKIVYSFYSWFIDSFLADRNSALARMMDSYRSACVYCWNIRSAMLGLALGLILGGRILIAVLVLALVWIFVLIENIGWTSDSEGGQISDDADIIKKE